MLNTTLTDLRRDLHRLAEPSGLESKTAEFLADRLDALKPDRLESSFGGNGLVAAFEGRSGGETVLVRADMDALPIPESPELEHASLNPEVSHRCGHDGHMTMLLGAARAFAGERPERGRVLLLFQPSEEDGAGAARVIADERWAGLGVSRCVALHNLPGHPLGRVVLRDGPLASASKGLTVELVGTSSHAAEPHLGRSPVAAAAAIATGIQAAPQRAGALEDCLQATVVGVEVGGPYFGTAPGSGRVMATLRAHTNEGMARLSDYSVELARGLAAAHGLACEISWSDDFPATVNDSGVTATVRRAAMEEGLPVLEPPAPFAWSEDFGHFTAAVPGALFGLGAGEEQPPLHSPDYDFPDELLPIGARLLERVARRLLETG